MYFKLSWLPVFQWNPGLAKTLLAMKLTVLFICITCLQVSAEVTAQRITIAQKGISLKKVFRAIEAQTDYHFFYKDRLIRQAAPLNIEVSNASVEEVLNTCLKGLALSYSIVDKIIVIKEKQVLTAVEKKITDIPVPEIAALPPTVTGQVKDEKGAPLQGVAIKVAGTQRGAITDQNGHFLIDATIGDVLEFSFVGYKKRTAKISSNTAALSVQMEIDIAVGEDVIVIGYGVQKKINATGAVSQITASQIKDRPVTNALSALQGVSPGLLITRTSGQPGNEGYNANIRGLSSVNGANSPLVIIDGSPGTLSTLNPNDIESISILKDAASAAIYGAESSDGIIVITTKTARNQKMKLEYNGLFTNNTVSNQPVRNPSWLQAEQQRLAGHNAGGTSGTTDAHIRWLKNEDTNYLPNPGGWFDVYENLDYVKMMMRDQTGSMQHNLSASGGQGKTNYLLSLGHYTQNGLFKFGPDSYKRINARINMNTQLSNTLSFSARMSFTNLQTLAPSQNVEGDNNLLYVIYTTRGIYPTYLPNNDGSTAGSYDDSKYFSGGMNAFPRIKDGGNRTVTNNRLESVFTLKAENIVNGLTLRAIYSPRLIVGTDNTFLKSVLRYDRGGGASSNILNNPNQISKSRSSLSTHNMQLLADYDYSIKNIHNFHLLGGYQFDSYSADTITAIATNLISNDVASLNTSANPALSLPVVRDIIGRKVLLSYFARLNYNYDSKYLFEATVRNDGSSQLAPGFRKNWFYAFSGGWNLSRESWFANMLPFFNECKLRGSWGVVGNSSVSRYYDYIALLSTGSAYPFNNAVNNSIYQQFNVSPEKGWERVSTLNFGLDLRLLKNRLSLTLEQFVRENDNMLISPTLPAVFGISPAQQNAASLKTWGFEIEAKWSDHIGKLNYFIQANISDAKNKLVSYGGQNVYQAGENRLIEGLPVNTIWGYQSAGLFQDAASVAASAKQDSRTGPGDIKYIDQNKDNLINIGKGTREDHGDLVMLGETTPHYSFGTTLGLNWNGFDFSIFVQGILDRKMLIYTHAAVPYVNSWRQSWEIQNDYWTPTNPNARFPRLFLGGTHNIIASDRWVQKATYLRIKNLQLGYTLPAKWTQKAKINSARIFFTGQDLWETTGMWFTYYDPEVPNNTSFGYPFMRSMAAGITVTF